MITTGLVLGKFWPFHRGHQHIIDFAKSQVDEVYVIVTGRNHHDIPLAVRVDWIRQCNPTVHVQGRSYDDVDEWDSKLWASLTIKWLGFRPDKVFTSEHYGEAWAHYMQSEHVLVDLDRKFFDIPISGTLCRENPFAVWEYLTPPAQEYYATKLFQAMGLLNEVA